MIIQPINLELKNFFQAYSDTNLFYSLEEFEKSNSGIYVDFENNTIRFKNDGSRYCWGTFTLPDIYTGDEYYLEYEIRKCSGESLKLSIEKNNVYRQKAYSNTKTEWEKHCNKIIINKVEKNKKRAFLSLGNTINIVFECEIRNLKIKIKSNKIDYFTLINKDKRKILSQNSSKDSFYIGKTENITNTWFTFKFLHLSNYISDLHSISCYSNVNQTMYTISHLGKKDTLPHFEVFKRVVGNEVEFYLNINRTTLINDIVNFDLNSVTKVELPLKKIENIPVDAEKMIPIEYGMVELQSNNQDVNTAKIY